MSTYQLLPSLKILSITQAKHILSTTLYSSLKYPLSSDLLSSITQFTYQSFMPSLSPNANPTSFQYIQQDLRNLHRTYHHLLNYLQSTPKLYVSLTFPFDLASPSDQSSNTVQSIASQMQIIIYRPSKNRPSKNRPSKNHSPNNHSPNKETNQTTSNQSFQKCIILDQFHLNLILKIDPILHKKIGDSLDDGDEFPPFKFS